MDLGIQNKVALVMGAGGGLGSAISKSLAHEGCLVVLADLDLAAAQRICADIIDCGGRALAVEWDLSKSLLTNSRFEQITRTVGNIDILINNSGGPRPAKTQDISETDWRDYFESMVLSLMTLTRLTLPAMQKNGWGRIITSTSSGVVAPISGLAASNSLRLALVGWSKSLAQEVAGDGVTVNVVVPGRIATQRIESLDLTRAIAAGMSPHEIAAASTASIPIGRYGEPREYADAVAFLASQRASYITGAILRVDGGLIQSI